MTQSLWDGKMADAELKALALARKIPSAAAPARDVTFRLALPAAHHLLNTPVSKLARA